MVGLRGVLVVVKWGYEKEGEKNYYGRFGRDGAERFFVYGQTNLGNG